MGDSFSRARQKTPAIWLKFVRQKRADGRGWKGTQHGKPLRVQQKREMMCPNK